LDFKVLKKNGILIKQPNSCQSHDFKSLSKEYARLLCTFHPGSGTLRHASLLLGSDRFLLKQFFISVSVLPTVHFLVNGK